MMAEQHDDNNHFLKLLKKIVLVFSILIFFVSGALLLKYYVIDPYIFDKNLNDIKKIRDNNQNRDFTELLKVNQDIKGWIKIDGTVVDYPVWITRFCSPAKMLRFFILTEILRKKKTKKEVYLSILISKCLMKIPKILSCTATA